MPGPCSEQTSGTCWWNLRRELFGTSLQGVAHILRQGGEAPLVLRQVPKAAAVCVVTERHVIHGGGWMGACDATLPRMAHDLLSNGIVPACVAAHKAIAQSHGRARPRCESCSAGLAELWGEPHPAPPKDGGVAGSTSNGPTTCPSQKCCLTICLWLQL